MNTNTKNLRVSMKNEEMAIWAFHMKLHETYLIGSEFSILFCSFGPKTQLPVYCKNYLLGEILDVFPLYEWCLLLSEKSIEPFNNCI